jgi:hypothetical protein
MDSDLFLRLCHIFPACGIRDLKAGVCKVNATSLTVFFIRDGLHYPFPRNGFFSMENDTSRYSTNMQVYDRVMAEQSPFIEPVPESTIEAFLSISNCNRLFIEGKTDVTAQDYDRVHRLYSNSVILTRDESALRTLEIIDRRHKNVTFCSTDDDISGLVPASLRMLVAEGFAGLALVAFYRGSVCQVVLMCV